MRDKIDIQSIDVRLLIYNLYLTQIITLIIAFIISFILHDKYPVHAILTIIPENVYQSLLYGIIFAFIAISIDIFLAWILPEEMLDDGGINEKLLKNMPIWHIFIIANVVGFIEEFLFRGAIQPTLGLWLTSMIFTLIHFRYLKKIVLIIVTLLLSLGLGWLTQHTGSWFSSYIAHTLIDFILGIFIRNHWLSFK